MIDNFAHFNNSNKFSLLVDLCKKIYKVWLPIYRNFPKVEKFGIGQKIDHLFLELLENLRIGIYSQQNERLIILDRSIQQIDSLKFFLQLCWEINLITAKQYARIGPEIEKLGKAVGAMKRNLAKKTSA